MCPWPLLHACKILRRWASSDVQRTLYCLDPTWSFLDTKCLPFFGSCQTKHCSFVLSQNKAQQPCKASGICLNWCHLFATCLLLMWTVTLRCINQSLALTLCVVWENLKQTAFYMFTLHLFWINSAAMAVRLVCYDNITDKMWFPTYEIELIMAAGHFLTQARESRPTVFSTT